MAKGLNFWLIHKKQLENSVKMVYFVKEINHF